MNINSKKKDEKINEEIAPKENEINDQEKKDEEKKDEEIKEEKKHEEKKDEEIKEEEIKEEEKKEEEKKEEEKEKKEIIIKEKPIIIVPEKIKNSKELSSLYITLQYKFLNRKEKYNLIISLKPIYETYDKNIKFLLDENKNDKNKEKKDKEKKKKEKKCNLCNKSISSSKIVCTICGKKLCSNCKTEGIIPEISLKNKEPICEECISIINSSKKTLYDF